MRFLIEKVIVNSNKINEIRKISDTFGELLDYLNNQNDEISGSAIRWSELPFAVSHKVNYNSIDTLSRDQAFRLLEELGYYIMEIPGKYNYEQVELDADWIIGDSKQEAQKYFETVKSWYNEFEE